MQHIMQVFFYIHTQRSEIDIKLAVYVFRMLSMCTGMFGGSHPPPMPSNHNIPNQTKGHVNNLHVSSD